MSIPVVVSNTPIAITGKIVQYERSDGLNVFLDGDKVLDNIRLNADKATVIKAVALRRCQQIARCYARQHAPELLKDFQISDGGFRRFLTSK